MSELKNFYDSVRSLTPDSEVTYNGLTIQKLDAVGEISSPDHSEVGVYNEGNKVEVLSLSAMSYNEFRSLLDEIAAEDPKSVNEWLNRDK
jgi:hypothetical protein